MLLDVQGVSKRYRTGVLANDDVTVRVDAGEVFGLLGPNGAGKTTLISQIIGQALPTSGRITLAGADVIARPDRARSLCSYQPQTQVPIWGLTPLEAIELVGRVRGGDRQQVRRRARALVDELDLGQWADRRSQMLSGGVARLTAFCMAAVVPGRLVILDEPTNDVDPLRRRLLWQLVRRLAGDGSAVMLVSHNVLEAERAVDRLAVMHRARVVATGTPASLKRDLGRHLRVELTLEPGVQTPQTPEFLASPVVLGRRVISDVRPDGVGRVLGWAEHLRDTGVVEEFSLGPATLEDAYARIIDADTREGEHVALAP